MPEAHLAKRPGGSHLVWVRPASRVFTSRRSTATSTNWRDPQHQVFSNLGSSFERTVTLALRSASDVAVNASVIRSAVSSIDPQLAIGTVRTMQGVIDDSVAPRRLNFVLVSTFAFVALALTCAGLYGVMSYTVAQRTKEIGVRMALGATRRQVLAMIFRQAGSMTIAGIGAGLAGALALSRSISSLLFAISADDPVILGTVSVLLAAVTLVAVAVPATRATRIDPLAALRDD
jgi:putative ABC transport system permease protein